MQFWLRHNVPSEIAFGKGCDSSVAAAEFFESLARDGFGGALDFSKCYDCMRPQATVHLMRLAGFPEGLCRLCLAPGCVERTDPLD